MSKHFGFYVNNALVGFCCINDDGYLLQFHLETNSKTSAQALFTLMVEQNSNVIGEIKGAFVSTAEPHYMSLCLDNSSIFKMNALMYQQDAKMSINQKDTIDMEVATEQQLAEYVQFSTTNISAPEQWLNSYYGKLIKRKELLGYRKKEQLSAVGECRLFDEYQTEYADLGMIVDQSMRGQGIAKKVLQFLTTHASSKGLQSICSTESNNFGAQKAISSAGFLSTNRIVQFKFNTA
jgi:RimJ/RimL family protein N-acetyltransferase